jgi:hypothetical protein
MSLRFFFHVVLQQVYALVQSTPEPQWHTTYPDGSPTRFLNLHMYARTFPDAGYPESECSLIPVQEAMFTCFLKEVTLQEAAQADLHLVQYAQRISKYPQLPQVLALMPRWTKLFLMEVDYTDSYHLFDVYRVAGPEEKLVCLTPLLLPLFEYRDYGGHPRLHIPFRGTYQEAGDVLAQAIEVRLWGTRDHAPAYAYEVETC